MGAMFIAIVAACIVTFWTVPTTYDINAETETLHMKSSNYSSVQWTIRDALMFRDFDSESENVSGLLSPSGNVDILFERIGSGPLRVRFLSSAGSVGSIWDNDGKRIDLGRRVSFVFQDLEQKAKAGNTILLPLIGEIEIGRSLSFDGMEQQAALRTGNIRILGTSLLNSTLFQAGSYPLEFGDDIRIQPSQTPSFGLLVSSDQPGLKVSIRGRSTSAIVTRFGSMGYEIRTSAYSRLKNDPVLQILWVACLAFVGTARSLGKEQKV
jgi:hypothetical protein